MGPVGLRVACLPHVHSAYCGVGTFVQFAAVGSRPFDRRLEPLFSAWLGSLHSFCCARLTLVFGTASQGSFIRSAPGTLGHSGGPGGSSGTNGLLQRPGGVGGGQASPAFVRPTFGIAYGSSSWRLRTASSARTFPRWRMSGTARTN